ncbi:DNA polymerase I [Moorena sp. SIO1G6]|uniref:DNA polymerase I n=1 Tax=Moorena sp. SIO1G6 TaxID=2607840 RepID=UPI0025808E8A|nr:DNA polymerase I [Moorena sp. SIO1G6]
MPKSTSSDNSPPVPDDSPMAASPLLILIDGHSLAFRSYFAFAKSRQGGLRTKTGIPTSVCFGFIKSLLEVMESENPNAIAIAFDTKEATFRQQADATYKANRTETPEDFLPDVKNLQQLLQGLRIPVITSPGYEADDVLATLAHQAIDQGYRVKVVSGDRDLFQLVAPDKGITVLYLSGPFSRGSATVGPTEYGLEEVEAKLGVLPSQVVDYKALCGDPSDNIPGVKGIGAKTAVKLLKEYQNLDNIYASLDTIKGAVKKKLEVGKLDAEHARYLAQLRFDTPVDIDLDQSQLQGFDPQVLKPLLEKLELKSFISQIDKLQQRFGGVVLEDIETNAPNDTNSDTNSDTDSNTDTQEDDDIAFFSAAETEEFQEQGSNTGSIQPQIIDNVDKLNQLVEQLKYYTDAGNPVAWDTETSDLEPRDAQLVGIGCCWGKELTDVAYIPIGHKDGTNLDKDIVLASLRPILESSDYPKVLQNSKFDRLVFRCNGIQLAGVVFDTMLASYVLNPETSHKLSDLGLHYLGIEAQSYEDLVPKGKTIGDLDIPTVADYCGMDAYTTFGIVSKLREELAKIPALQELLLDVEQPLEPVLAEMEYQGISIDKDYLEQFSQELEKDLVAIKQQAYQDAGQEFNLGSPKQLSQLLFEKLGLDRRKSRKTKTGYSTDATILAKLQGDHPVVDAVLEYRSLSKLKSTYVDALPALMRSDTKRVHTDFNQTVTTTGRLSSSSPNLQNIPIRTDFSRQIRKGFIPESGWLLVSADYSQIELRILAHLSQEPVLVEAYQTQADVHTLTAQMLFDKEEITAEERRLGKIINFGVIYGMGAQRFAREAKVSTAEGKEFIDRLNQRYPLVFAYLEETKKKAIAQGYVETILGRRRYFSFSGNSLRRLQGKALDQIDLDKLKSINPYDAGSLRAAANSPIQGSSADIIKIAMVNLYQELQKYQARLLLQVHDELIFEIPPDEWEELQVKIRETMESAVELSVPLVVEIHAGDNWMEAK